MKFPRLFDAVCTVAPLPPTEWLKVEALSTLVTVARRGRFLEEGESSDRCGVVSEGVFRAYRLTPDGVESVKAFRAEGEFIGAYAEALQGVPSQTFIEALESSRVMTFRLSDVLKLEDGHPAWSRFWRRLAERHFLLKERREQEFLTLSAEARLRRFRQEHAHLAGRVPQRQVAAYLGITPVGLSRISGRLRRGGGTSVED